MSGFESRIFRGAERAGRYPAGCAVLSRVPPLGLSTPSRATTTVLAMATVIAAIRAAALVFDAAPLSPPSAPAVR